MAKQVCWICGSTDTAPHMERAGNEFAFVQVEAKHQERWRHFCPKCAAERNEQLQRDRAELNSLKKAALFERAQQILEGQRFDMYEIREALDAVEDFTKENPDRFDSAYEMIAAVVLIYNRVRCKPQQKIGKYQADFVLPDEHVILEIDGYQHQNRATHDSKRDREIRRALGPEWEIVRIPTKYLDQNAKELVNAIRAIRDQRANSDTARPNRQTDRFARLNQCLYGRPE